MYRSVSFYYLTDEKRPSIQTSNFHSFAVVPLVRRCYRVEIVEQFCSMQNQCELNQHKRLLIKFPTKQSVIRSSKKGKQVQEVQESRNTKDNHEF